MQNENSPIRRRLYILLGNILAAAVLSLWALLFPDGTLAELLRLTQWQFEAKPTLFGAFHLSALAVCVALLASLVVYDPRRLGEKGRDTWLFSVGLMLFWLEIYKQLYYALVISPDGYDFSILPLQLCSYSLYCYLIIPLLPRGRLRDALLDFVALYLTMGGCLVLAYPVLWQDVQLSVHTMVWHILMVLTGAAMLLTTPITRRYRTRMLSAGAVFLSVLTLALILNVALKPLSLASPHPLNLFYISPYETSSYFIIGDVQAAFGWFPSVLTYIALYLSIGTHTVYAFGWVVEWAREHAKKGRAEK